MRALATIRKIADIQPIDGADQIVVATIDGWKLVVKKGEFKVGDLACYLEIDSWVPTELAPFLSKGQEPREYNGVKGERLRTIKLRGQVSQGLLLNPTSVDQYIEYKISEEEPGAMPTSRILMFGKEGDDLTEALGIQKWEAPIPAQLQGQASGAFPTSLIPKTDQERCCDADTVVITKDGNKTIKEICESKYEGGVLSFNHETGRVEYKKVIGHSIMTRKIDQWLLIKTKSGKEIRVTKNHKIYMSELGCYREAQHVKVGDSVNILS